MNKFLGSALAVALLFGGLGPVDARDLSSSKLTKKIGKKNSQYTEEYMDQPGDHPQDISEIVDATSEEVRLLIEQAVADAVDAAVADNTDGGSTEDVVVVDSEGNKLEIVSIDEDGTITVDLSGDDNPWGPRRGWDGSSSK
ncbi:MAG: hypothetical protein VX294_05335 [Candidatus Latescibacterota bacterium]|nr:hypothetical protein [Candidatus Latescibacterota bacterium]